MQFNGKTGLGRVWVDLVRAGTYTEEQVPNIGNLREVVHNELTGGNEA